MGNLFINTFTNIFLPIINNIVLEFAENGEIVIWNEDTFKFEISKNIKKPF